jgi:hypothetical protein
VRGLRKLICVATLRADTQCERRFDWLFVPIQAELLTAEGVVRDALIAHCRENHENHPKKMACDPAVLLSDGSIRGRSRVLELDFYPRSTHGQPAPLLLNLDDRLARIESLLVTMGSRLDRLERLAMRIDHHTQKPEPKRRES